MGRLLLLGAGAAVGGGTIGPPDANFASVVLLIGPTGADAATSTTDESTAAHTPITFNGNAQVDTGQSVYGTSLQFDGTGDYLNLGDSNDWDFGSGVFTIEFIVRFSSGFGTGEAFIGQWTGTNATSAWFFYLDSGTLRFRFINNADDSVKDTTVAWTPTVDTNYVMCAERGASNKFRIYRNGTMIASATHNFTIKPSATNLTIARVTGFPGYDLTGRMEEIRITKGVARYDSDSGYTPDVAKFPRY